MNKSIIILSIFFLLFSACTEEIDLDLNSGDNLKLVVDAWIDDSGRRQFVNLSLTADYYDNTDGSIATGATVSIVGDSKTYELLEESPGKYFFQEDFEGSVGTNYQLKINYNDVEYLANQTIQPSTSLDNVTFDFEETDREDEKLEYYFYASLKEIEGEGDYYYFNHYQKGDLPELNFDYAGFGSDEGIDAEYIEDIEVSYGYYNPGDTVIVQLYTISKEANDYLTAIDSQTDTDAGIFSVPLANIEGNISGDARGFFIVSAVSEFEVVLE